MFGLKLRLPLRAQSLRNAKRSRVRANRYRLLTCEGLEERRTFAADLGSVADEAAEIAEGGIGSHACFPLTNDASASVASATAAQTDAAFAALQAEGESSGDPAIVGFEGNEQQGSMWVFQGHVTDDGPVSGLTVYYYVDGFYKGSRHTGSGGDFSFSFWIDPQTTAYVSAYAIDSDDLLPSEWVDWHCSHNPALG